MSEHPYMTVKDNDCHVYVIPRDRLTAWEAWLDVPEPDLSLPDDQIDYTAWNPPEFAVMAGGRVRFHMDGTYTIG